MSSNNTDTIIKLYY